MDDNHGDRLFEQIVAEPGLMTRDQVAECRRVRDRMLATGRCPLSLAHVARERGHLDREMFLWVVDRLVAGGVYPQLGEFELIERVGTGGTGAVYKARRAGSGELLALKVLHAEQSADPRYLRRFLYEARLAQRLDHPNAVPARAFGEIGGRHYIAMEFVDGRTVADLLRPGPMSEGTTLRVGRQVASALGCAHALGIVHRDVKPANILLTPDGVARLNDLGIARQTDGANPVDTEPGTRLGTPLYMSPEQRAGLRDLDTRTDIYSLGATLFRMLTGRVPYEDGAPKPGSDAEAAAQVPSARALNPKVCEATDQLLRDMMALRRENRPAGCGTVIERIDRILAAGVSSEPVALEQVVALTPKTRPGTQRRGWWVRCVAALRGMLGLR